MDDDDDIGLRIIAGQLVALGALAERAAYRSFPVRWFMLWVLCWALTVGFDFVVQETSASWLRHKMPCDLRCRCSDALRLAALRRALGAALFTLPRCSRRVRALSRAIPSAWLVAARCQADGPGLSLAQHGALASPCADTS